MTAIIVDDELHCREVLQMLLELHCPDVEVRTICEDGEQALQAIALHNPQLVFLDIEMPA